jgi:hypothetical protein
METLVRGGCVEAHGLTGKEAGHTAKGGVRGKP